MRSAAVWYAVCTHAGLVAILLGLVHSHALRIRETLLRLGADLTGHRLLRGGVVPGGAMLHRLPDLTRLEAIRADIRELVALALSHTIVRDRFTGTGVLTTRQARDLGALGYVARASGVNTDARRDHPVPDAHRRLTDFLPTTRTSGDVLARFLVRADEIDTSLDLITDLITALAPEWTPGQTSGWPRHTVATQTSSGVGIVEGWRGTIVHRVELAPDRTLIRVKIADPSFFNWPALPVALRQTIVPTFRSSINPSTSPTPETTCDLPPDPSPSHPDR